MIVVDCDDTLWGGIVGEEGVEGIALDASNTVGMIFQEVQTYLRYLKNKGVLLALCSKNNEADVKLVFNRHHDMPLNWADFSVTKVNWNDKPTNLR